MIEKWVCLLKWELWGKKKNKVLVLKDGKNQNVIFYVYELKKVQHQSLSRRGGVGFDLIETYQASICIELPEEQRKNAQSESDSLLLYLCMKLFLSDLFGVLTLRYKQGNKFITMGYLYITNQVSLFSRQSKRERNRAIRALGRFRKQ